MMQISVAFFPTNIVHDTHQPGPLGWLDQTTMSADAGGAAIASEEQATRLAMKLTNLILKLAVMTE